MFTLRIHSVDSPQPLIAATTAPFITAAAATSRTKSTAARGPNPSLNATELRCVVHLFRNFPAPPSTIGAITTTAPSFLSNPTFRTTLVFITAVPNYFSPDDFFSFCGSELDYFSKLCFLRNDGMEDRYSVIIKLVSQMAADGFYCNFNGKRFKPSETEVCHVYFTQSLEYSESAEIAAIPPPGFTELPTCPVCLERLDYDTSAIHITLCDHSFDCSCISKWTYLSCQVCRLCQQQDVKPTCAVCGTSKNPWACLICGFVGCGRYEEGHAIRHWKDTQHCYSLELETQQIWDYVGDKYVHRLNQSKAYGKSIATNFRCMSLDGECGTCDNNEDSGIGGALFSSKVEAIVDEYNNLLATQMETQRQHYELLLAEAKSRKESSIVEAIEKTETERIQKFQNKMEELIRETKVVADINEDLTKNQEVLRKTFKEIEERETASLKLRDEKILDLEEQIRDLKVYIEAQRTLSNTTYADEIKGGTLLPIQPNQSDSSNKPKRRGKSGRKR